MPSNRHHNLVRTGESISQCLRCEVEVEDGAEPGECPGKTLMQDAGDLVKAALQLPTEAQECAALAKWLDRAGVLYTHVPLGGLRDRKAAALLRNMGAKRGVPDYLIFTTPPHWWHTTHQLATARHRGVALEMKRRKGGSLSEQQKWWIAQLKLAGWHVIVARGAQDAVTQLTALGYGQQTDREVAR